MGYTVVRKLLRLQEGWKIGPLYANNSMIAQSLYQAVFNKVSIEDPTAGISITIPYGDLPNPDTIVIVRNIPAMVDTLTTCRVYTHGIPPGLQLQKIFATTCSEIGL